MVAKPPVSPLLYALRDAARDNDVLSIEAKALQRVPSALAWSRGIDGEGDVPLPQPRRLEHPTQALCYLRKGCPERPAREYPYPVLGEEQLGVLVGRYPEAIVDLLKGTF